MSERQLQAGYAAWEAGKPFDKFQSDDWQDGWKSADDFAWWKRFASALGAQVIGFSHRCAATLSFPNGDTPSVSGSLVKAIERLIASVDTDPKGGDAKQAPCGSIGSAVGAAETPNTGAETDNG